MSVGDFVDGCMMLLGSRMYHPAMCLAMNALDATAKREYPNLRGEKDEVHLRCMTFARDHYDIITAIGTGGTIYSAPGSRLILQDPKAGTKPLEDILYYSVRCQLTHEAELPANTFFNEQPVFGKTAQGFSIPVHFVYAVILAVVGAKSNSHETSDAKLGLTVMGKAIPIADCWGNKDKVLALLGIGSKP